MRLRGSLRYGNSFPDSTIAMWPLAKLQVEDESIKIMLPWRKFAFPKQNITRLIKHRGLVAIGIQIEHTMLEEPNLMVFWTYHFGDVKKAIQAKGFTFSLQR